MATIGASQRRGEEGALQKLQCAPDLLSERSPKPHGAWDELLARKNPARLDFAFCVAIGGQLC